MFDLQRSSEFVSCFGPRWSRVSSARRPRSPRWTDSTCLAPSPWAHCPPCSCTRPIERARSPLVGYCPRWTWPKTLASKHYNNITPLMTVKLYNKRRVVVYYVLSTFSIPTWKFSPRLAMFIWWAAESICKARNLSPASSSSSWRAARFNLKEIVSQYVFILNFYMN